MAGAATDSGCGGDEEDEPQGFFTAERGLALTVQPDTQQTGHDQGQVGQGQQELFFTCAPATGGGKASRTAAGEGADAGGGEAGQDHVCVGVAAAEGGAMTPAEVHSVRKTLLFDE
jgi:hypothetical protein